MGKLPLKEILTVLLISHLSILIAGQLGKPKEPVLGAEANWSVELGKLRGGTGAGMGEKAKRGKAAPARSLSARGAPAAAGEAGGAAPRIRGSADFSF